MAKQDINRGTVAGDGPGEYLFDAFGKCINNFDDAYQHQADLASTANGNGSSLVAIEDAADRLLAVADCRLHYRGITHGPARS